MAETSKVISVKINGVNAVVTQLGEIRNAAGELIPQNTIERLEMVRAKLNKMLREAKFDEASDEFKKLQERIVAVDNQLKALRAGVTKPLTIDTAKSISDLRLLRSQLISLRDAAEIGSEAFKQYNEQIDAVDKKLQEANPIFAKTTGTAKETSIEFKEVGETAKEGAEGIKALTEASQGGIEGLIKVIEASVKFAKVLEAQKKAQDAMKSEGGEDMSKGVQEGANAAASALAGVLRNLGAVGAAIALVGASFYSMFLRAGIPMYKITAILEGLKNVLISFTEPLAAFGRLLIQPFVSAYQSVSALIKILSGEFKAGIAQFGDMLKGQYDAFANVAKTTYKAVTNAADTFNRGRLLAEKKALAELKAIYTETAAIQLEAQKAVTDQLLSDSRLNYEQRRKLAMQSAILEQDALKKRLASAKEVYEAEKNMILEQLKQRTDGNKTEQELLQLLSKEEQERLEKNKQAVINAEKDIKVAQIKAFQEQRDMRREQNMFELELLNARRDAQIAANDYILKSNKASFSEETKLLDENYKLKTQKIDDELKLLDARNDNDKKRYQELLEEKKKLERDYKDESFELAKRALESVLGLNKVEVEAKEREISKLLDIQDNYDKQIIDKIQQLAVKQEEIIKKEVELTKEGTRERTLAEAEAQNKLAALREDTIKRLVDAENRLFTTRQQRLAAEQDIEKTRLEAQKNATALQIAALEAEYSRQEAIVSQLSSYIKLQELQQKNLREEITLANAAKQKTIDRIDAEKEFINRKIELQGKAYAEDLTKLKELENAKLKAEIEFNQKAAEIRQKYTEKATADALRAIDQIYRAPASGLRGLAEQIMRTLGADSVMVKSVVDGMQQVFDAVQNAIRVSGELAEKERQAQMQAIQAQEAELDASLQAQDERINEARQSLNDLQNELANAEGERRDKIIEAIEREKQKVVAAENAKAAAAAKKNKLEQQRLELEKQSQEAQRESAKIAAVLAAANQIAAVATATLAAAKAFTPGPEGLTVVGLAVRVAAALALVASMIGAFTSVKAAAATFEKGGMVEGPRHSRGGVMINVEGGEFVVNRVQTARYRPVLEAINAGKYEQGGIVEHNIPKLEPRSVLRAEDIAQALRENPPVVAFTQFEREYARYQQIKNSNRF